MLDSGSVEAVVRVRDLRVWHSDSTGRARVVLAGVDLDLEKGEVLGISGRSGSGKTTLALAILKSLPAGSTTQGTVEFTGRWMAPVFQEANGALHPMLTVGTQITEALRARRNYGRAERKALALAALASTGLAAHYFNAWPHQLSGGEKQRALIAQAIVGDPDLLIADEPTASLDAAAQAGVMAVLRELQHRLGMAMILVSHSRDLLEGFANRALTMRDGFLSG